MVPKFTPDNPRQFGGRLKKNFESMLADSEQAGIGGYDKRRLMKIVLRPGEVLPKIGDIPGVELVSHEESTIVLAFADAQGVSEFEARLTTLAQKGTATRKEILFAIQDFSSWTPEDRSGAALKTEGPPATEEFILDVELWPLDTNEHRNRLLKAFLEWLGKNQIEILDQLMQPSLIMVKVRVNKVKADLLLNHRDVRTVDLPPKVGLALELVLADIQSLPQFTPPDASAGSVCILDSGLNANHPLLQGIVGEAVGFLPPHKAAEDNPDRGHGTFVSGLAAFGSIESILSGPQAQPDLRIFSGKVFNDDDSDQTKFVEKAVEEAVHYFQKEYGCKVFNLSYGDLRKSYDGRHVKGLAYTLDRLTRELGVLFVVPTGNITDIPTDKTLYPKYLLDEINSIVDPATALNVITVGGIARKTASREAQKHTDRIEDVPIAGMSEPSPFTRCGPSVAKAVKPDFVEEAGNLAYLRHARGNPRHMGLGLISLNSGFANGKPFREDYGTSFAAPIVARKAAKLATAFPESSMNFIRSLLALHARWPKEAVDLLNPNRHSKELPRVLNLIGYGQVDDVALYSSQDQIVTLFSEESIENNKHHFYELPIPDEFWTGKRKLREVAVSLAYSPEVRTTRLDYKKTKLWFTLVNGKSLDHVTKAFVQNRQKPISERATNRTVGLEARKPGTLQMSSWSFSGALRKENKLFIVITRQDANWSDETTSPEPYALSVLLRDTENTSVNLYAKVSEQLRLRAQERARARY